MLVPQVGCRCEMYAKKNAAISNTFKEGGEVDRVLRTDVHLAFNQLHTCSRPAGLAFSVLLHSC